MYDLIRESDDDEFDKSKDKSKKKLSPNNSSLKGASQITNLGSSPSPKPTAPRKPAQEPINLLAASLHVNQKKKSPLSNIPPRKIETELEKAISEVSKLKN